MLIPVSHKLKKSVCGLSDSASGVQEDRKKVPWSDKETIILLEAWGDQQVKSIKPRNACPRASFYAIEF